MQFILTAGWEDGVAALTERLIKELSRGKQVLWLVSGGSNIPASAEIMKHIPADLSQKLTVMPIDERYGPPGHADSNWAQLIQAGFDGQQAKLVPVLRQGQSFEQAVKDYQSLIQKAFADNEIIIGQVGIGQDGHIVGILPDSPAIDATGLVYGYKWSPYQRLTMTFEAFRKLTVAYVFTFGAAKLPTLTALRDQALPLKDQPAQILKELPEAYVYNDQVGD